VRFQVSLVKRSIFFLVSGPFVGELPNTRNIEIMSRKTGQSSFISVGWSWTAHFGDSVTSKPSVASIYPRADPGSSNPCSYPIAARSQAAKKELCHAKSPSACFVFKCFVCNQF
jgi:hypothetical protein